MKVGQYWYAMAGDGFPLGDSGKEATREYWNDREWLFLLVATTTENRKRYWLGIKCNQQTGAPLTDGEQAYWFGKDGSQKEDDWFFLAERCIRKNPRRFLSS